MNKQITSKICNICGKDKDFSEYHKAKNGKYGLRTTCKECRSEKSKDEWKLKSIGRVRKPRKKKIKVLPDIKEKECRICHEIKDVSHFNIRPYYLTYRHECKLCENNRKKEYAKINRKKISAREREFYKNPEKKARKSFTRNKRERERRLQDPAYRLKKNLKTSLRIAFKLYSKNGKTKSCKDYGIDFEKIFNKLGPCPGSGKDWHLDHIIPISAFDLDNPEHVKLAHLPENLQWLNSKINTSKSDSILDCVYENEILKDILKLIGKYDPKRDIS